MSIKKRWEIKVAGQAGFCAGVQKAVDTAASLAGEENVYTLGPLVHNQEVVNWLVTRGIKPVNSLGEIEQGTVIFRSHGEGPAVFQEAREKGIKVVDATCPFVRRVQDTIISLLEEGYRVFISGDPRHPEVKGLLGWSRGQAVVLEESEDPGAYNWEGRVALVAQTTLTRETFERTAAGIRRYNPGVLVKNTICQATSLRQKAALELCREVELMLVIGGMDSSNTSKLANVCKLTGVPTYHIEKAAELKRDWLENIKLTGVTAGASTPAWSIKEVIKRMSEFEKGHLEEEEVVVEEGVEESQSLGEEPGEESLETGEPSREDEPGTAESPAGDEQAGEGDEVGPGPGEGVPGEPETVPEESHPEGPGEEVAEGMEEGPGAGEEVEAPGEEEEVPEEVAEEITEEDYHREMVTLEKGKIVRGKVVQVGEDELLVDIGQKADGVVPRGEIAVKAGESLTDIIQLGDELDLLVLRVPASDDDKILLSKKKFERENAWLEVEKSFNEGNVFDAEVIEVVKGGLIVDLGVRGFLPASLVDLRYVPDLQQFVGKEIRVQIIEFNRGKNKVVVSRKKVLEEEMKQAKEETLARIEAGMMVKGIVRRLTDFGAFVDIGGIDGLVHISEISWQRIDHPSDVLNVDEEIEVKILSINLQDERISLSIKQAQPDPWTQVSDRFNKNDLVTGAIKCIVDFGIFVEIIPGVEGLVHISQLAEEHVSHPTEIVSEGEEVTVKILDINPVDKRISLSLREAKKEDKKKAVVTREEDEKEETGRGPGVTLGDVFGDLFTHSQEKAEESPAAEEETAKETAGDTGEEEAGDTGEEEAGDAGEEEAGDAGEEEAGDAGEEEAGDAGESTPGDTGIPAEGTVEGDGEEGVEKNQED